MHALSVVRYLNDVSCYYSADALQIVAELDNVSFVKLILKAERNVNLLAYEREETALQTASSQDYMKIVKILLSNETNVNSFRISDVDFSKTVLTIAVKMNNLKLIKNLLDVNVDVNAPSFSYFDCSALEVAKLQSTSFDIIDLLITKNAHENVLRLDSH